MGVPAFRVVFSACFLNAHDENLADNWRFLLLLLVALSTLSRPLPDPPPAPAGFPVSREAEKSDGEELWAVGCGLWDSSSS